jgi:hypothetical protein
MVARQHVTGRTLRHDSAIKAILVNARRYGIEIAAPRVIGVRDELVDVDEFECLILDLHR